MRRFDAIVVNVDIGGEFYLALFVLGSVNIPDGSGFWYGACGDLVMLY